MPPRHLTTVPGNIEEFQDSLRNRLGCEVNLKQRSSREPCTEVSVRSGLIFTNVRTINNVDIDITSNNIPDIVSIFAPESGAVLIRPDGSGDLTSINSNDVAIFDPRKVPGVTLSANSSTDYFTIQTSIIRQKAYSLTGAENKSTNVSFQLEGADTTRGRLMVNLLSSLTRCYRAHEHNVVSGFTVRQIEEAALFCLIDMISTEIDVERLRRQGSGRSTIKDAIDLAMNSTEPMTVGELAEALGVTARALQVAFRRDLGISPHTYLKQIRLLAVRREFEVSGHHDIHSIAKRWGFSNASRFRTEYVTAFGLASWPKPVFGRGYRR